MRTCHPQQPLGALLHLRACKCLVTEWSPKHIRSSKKLRFSNLWIKGLAWSRKGGTFLSFYARLGKNECLMDNHGTLRKFLNHPSAHRGPRSVEWYIGYIFKRGKSKHKNNRNMEILSRLFKGTETIHPKKQNISIIPQHSQQLWDGWGKVNSVKRKMQKKSTRGLADVLVRTNVKTSKSWRSVSPSRPAFLWQQDALRYVSDYSTNNPISVSSLRSGIPSYNKKSDVD